MVKKLADFLITKLGRVVFLITCIIVFCSSILLLEFFADSRDVWAFDCQSDMYELASKDEAINEQNQGLLYLALTVQDQQINLDYYNAKDSLRHEFVSFEGELNELEVANVVYQLDLVVNDVHFLESNPYLQNYLAKELNVTPAQLRQGGEVSVAVQVLEMDIKNKYILIKFKPYNVLWACRLHG